VHSHNVNKRDSILIRVAPGSLKKSASKSREQIWSAALTARFGTGAHLFDHAHGTKIADSGTLFKPVIFSAATWLW
jgi:hypothetical protein